MARFPCRGMSWQPAQQATMSPRRSARARPVRRRAAATGPNQRRGGSGGGQLRPCSTHSRGRRNCASRPVGTLQPKPRSQ
eukprot:5094296-Alexandrium_andersonii.AAC.1